VTVRETPDVPWLRPTRYAHVREIAVREGFRSSGIGRALMEYAHRWAKQEGFDEIRLGVCDFNKRAIVFYEGLGYATLRREMRKELSD
jgi:ribosomal protein S18 acetylase RimI-like enzyme